MCADHLQEKDAKATGCAEVNKPLSGSSYPVCSSHSEGCVDYTASTPHVDTVF